MGPQPISSIARGTTIPVFSIHSPTERRYPKKFVMTLLLRLAFLAAARKNVASSFTT
jgi:hypothetical protein